MDRESSTLVVVATYNEIENLPRLVEQIYRHAPDVDILVVDDNSPDGTGQWCDRRAAEDPRFRVIHRPGKLGLGTATLAGLRYAVERGYEFVLVMDADFSHDPRYLPALRAGVEGGKGEAAADVMIGSRYVAGGGVEGWPLARRIMSRAINAYARWMLGLPVRDSSGAFRCFRTAVLRRLDWNALHARGYAFLEELLWHLVRAGARFGEIPIVFVDRARGRSKITAAEALAALWVIFRLGVIHWTGRLLDRK